MIVVQLPVGVHSALSGGYFEIHGSAVVGMVQTYIAGVGQPRPPNVHLATVSDQIQLDQTATQFDLGPIAYV